MAFDTWVKSYFSIFGNSGFGFGRSGGEGTRECKGAGSGVFPSGNLNKCGSGNGKCCGDGSHFGRGLGDGSALCCGSDDGNGHGEGRGR